MAFSNLNKQEAFWLRLGTKKCHIRHCTNRAQNNSPSMVNVQLNLVLDPSNMVLNGHIYIFAGSGKQLTDIARKKSYMIGIASLIFMLTVRHFRSCMLIPEWSMEKAIC